jgi:hypothetical protein
MKYKSIVGFVLVVCVVATLWFISKYKDAYKEEVLLNISFRNVPNYLVLDTDYRQINLPVEVRASGFILIWKKIFGYKVELDFTENTYSRNDSLFFNSSQSIKKIKRSKTLSYEVLSTDDLDIFLRYQRFKSKKVPITHNINLEFTQNYVAIKKPYFQQDSVVITGNDDKVNALSEFLVSRDSKLIIKDSLTILEIDLKEMDSDLSFDPEQLRFTVEATQMTEGTIDVPVSLINKPPDYKVKLIPDNIQVVFSTAVSNFNEITANDFLISVNYELIDDLNISATPKVELLNKRIVSYRINPKKVQVLTIK